MTKRNFRLIISLVMLAFGVVFSAVYSFYQELSTDFAAIDYLQDQGYSSVRILQELPVGHGCREKDAYRFAFDAIPSSGAKRVEGRVCGLTKDVWYEERDKIGGDS